VRSEQNVLEHCFVQLKRRMLEGSRKAVASERSWAISRNIDTIDHDRSGTRLVVAADAIEQRRLSCAVWPDESQNLAGLNVEADLA
jgi:hypothetical protein